jgi:hypothetical protein
VFRVDLEVSDVVVVVVGCKVVVDDGNGEAWDLARWGWGRACL